MSTSLHIIRRSLGLWLSCFCLLTFSSCEDFFHSEVTYNGKKEEPKLVVNATLGNVGTNGVYVSQSYFLFDSAQYVLVSDTFFYDDGYYVSTYEDRSFGWLDDAEVTLTIGNNEPTLLTCYKPNANMVCYVADSSSIVIPAGDTVLLHVHHPAFGDAYGRQVQPAKVLARLGDVATNNFGQISFTLDIDPYTGADDDVISISYTLPEANGTVKQSTKQFIGSKSETWPFENYYGTKSLYSLDPVFAQLPNPLTSSGYYAGSASYRTGTASLYLPASTLRNGLKMKLLADLHLVENDPEVTYEVTYDTLLLQVDLEAHTYDDYRYTTSYNNMMDDYLSVYEPSHVVQTSGDDIFEEISEIFSSLGGAEQYLLFGNLSSKDYPLPTSTSSDIPDVYGHFSLYSWSYCTYGYYREK